MKKKVWGPKYRLGQSLGTDCAPKPIIYINRHQDVDIFLVHPEIGGYHFNTQEVDEPLQLDMSDLCLSDDLLQGNNGEPNY